MGWIYKPKEEQTLTCEFGNTDDGKIFITFKKDCGKFGADELIDMYTLTPDRLLEILQDRDDYKEEEL